MLDGFPSASQMKYSDPLVDLKVESEMLQVTDAPNRFQSSSG